MKQILNYEKNVNYETNIKLATNEHTERSPTRLEMLTTFPFDFCRYGTAKCVNMTAPFTLVAIDSSYVQNLPELSDDALVDVLVLSLDED